MNKIIEWVSQSGKQVKVEMDIYLDSACATAYVDGKHLFAGRPCKRDIKVGDLSFNWVLGSLCLTDERADMINQTLNQIQAEYDSRPEAAERILRSQRDQLIQDGKFLNGAINDAHEDSCDAMMADPTGRALAKAKKIEDDLEAELKILREKLKAFDAANPELLVKIKAEEKAELERVMWL